MSVGLGLRYRLWQHLIPLGHHLLLKPLPFYACRASSIKSAASLYADAASEFGDDPVATSGDKDVEAGTKPPAAAVGTEKRRTMLVPTDGGLVNLTRILTLTFQLARTLDPTLAPTLV